ncbi:hypothetical protein D5R93_01010 [Actinomyces lilanjuaniae]|uniref:Uncharacterized protein n=1 Tax=Actinomyces lilanjuaniae TaxID=2321394 RepID=A0ABN5PR20_9ACTO|nr:hypothetical protein [Actinomyces lilanjuaniae]AYD88986.1 hypothetical protein D5R93_01010 [Actinomyces lilanjuaniae]
MRHLILTHHGFFRGPGPVCPESGTRSGAGPVAHEPYQDPGSTRWRRQVTAVHRLSARYGPYSLALAEAVLRLADWEVSRREQSDTAAHAAPRHDTQDPSASRREQADDR